MQKSEEIPLNKRIARLSMAAMRKVAVVWRAGVEGVHLVDITTGRQMMPNDFHFHGIRKMQHRWQMILVAIGIEPNGDEYIKTEWQVLKEPRNHAATVEHFNKAHNELLNTINTNHEMSAAWVATIGAVDFTEDQLMRVLGK